MVLIFELFLDQNNFKICKMNHEERLIIFLAVVFLVVGVFFIEQQIDQDEESKLFTIVRIIDGIRFELRI